MTSPERPPPYRVTRGGEPSAAQDAAIAAALAELGRADAAHAGDTVHTAEVARAAPTPAWARAALTEGTTGITIATPQEL